MALTRTRAAKPATLFFERLILAEWLLKQLGISNWDKARAVLREIESESAPASDGVPPFVDGLRVFEAGKLGVGALDALDAAIRADWKSITDNRKSAGRPRCLYFQYLALCGSQLYLQRLFSDRAALLVSLNEAVTAWNDAHGAGDAIAEYVDADLNKLAFWSATGSGKTLLMHAQLRQYLRLAARARQEAWKDAPAPLDRIFLITPNESLSNQHREEAALSGLQAREFKAGPQLFDPQSAPTIETLTINRLGDEMGQKVVALSALAGVNLVLVDEGHRGASGEVWKKRRDELGKNGFALEYSATFGQAVGGDNGPLAQEYAKCIAFDYSYRRFYFDGYGKEFDIYNLAAQSDDAHRDRYLTACALSFLIQRRAYEKWGDAAHKFGFENPWWVWVGGTVNSPAQKQSLTAEEKTDVLQIVLFFQRITSQRAVFEAHIKALLERRGELQTGTRDPFYHAFDALVMDARATYDELMRAVFGTSGASGLTLEHLKGAEGEIALRAGNASAPFGLINVGDAAKFAELARENGLRVEEKAVSSSLFEGISRSDSPLSVLVGARKFAEGWNSFRVSTLGLMNIGRGEGSQIIQLFGRGVRLRGFENSLRRSSALETVELPDGAKLSDIAPLETLGVFGLRADYMETFREALRREGVPSGEKITLSIPTRPMANLDKLPPLHTLARPSKKKWDDCTAPLILGKFIFNLKEVNVAKVKADLYPKMQALQSSELSGDEGGGAVSTLTVKFGPEQLRFINWDKVMASLREVKESQGWTQLRLDVEEIKSLFGPLKNDWYELKAPDSFLEWPAHNVPARIALWRNTLTDLLLDLAKKFYAKARSDFERDDLRLLPLKPEDDGNWEKEWTLTLNESDAKLESEIGNLWSKFASENPVKLGPLDIRDVKRHFYSPLIHLGASDKIKVAPVALDKDEYKFARRLEEFAASNDSWLEHRQIFFFRNKVKTGIGFYDGGAGYYPDYALWVWETLPDQEPREYLAFFDPKGLLQHQPTDAKVELHKRIKTDYQMLLGNKITLNSFLVATTAYQPLAAKWNLSSEAELRALGVFLPETPVREMLDAMLI